MRQLNAAVTTAVYIDNIDKIINTLPEAALKFLQDLRRDEIR